MIDGDGRRRDPGHCQRSVIRYANDEQEVPEPVRRLIVMLTKHAVPKEFA